MIDNFYLLFWVVIVLYIWLDTDAFIEWGKLFRLRFLKYEAYEDSRKSSLGAATIKTYVDFLDSQYGDRFLIKLVCCPICLGVWLNIFLSSFTGWIRFGFNVIASWLLYYTLKFLIKKINV